MRYVIYCAAFAWLLYRVKNKEYIFDVVLISSLLLPDISTIEATNYMMIALLGVMLITKKVDKVYLQKDIAYYFGTVLIIAFIGMISWAIHGMNDVSEALRSTLTIVRYPSIILLTAIYENDLNWNFKYYVKGLYRAISIINIVELFCCIFQKANKVRAFSIFSAWYSYSDFYVNEISSANRYYRAYGTWTNAMGLGIWALLSMGLLLHMEELRKEKLWILNIICSFSVGAMSLTKTFFLGVIILAVSSYLVYIIRGLKTKYCSLKGFFRLIFNVMFVLICIKAFFAIYAWSETKWTHLHYYMAYVFKPFSAFDSRLSSSGSLLETIQVFLENWLIGVGPVQIKGELLGDNAFILLLHNGGVIAAGFMIWIIGIWCVKCLQRREYSALIIIALWLLCGLSLPVLMNHKICLLPLAYYLIVLWHKWEENDYINEVTIFSQERS